MSRSTYRPVLHCFLSLLSLPIFILCLRLLWACVALCLFRYETEPTDGDHLNFALRILQAEPMYLRWEDGYILNIYAPLYHYLMASVAAVVGKSTILFPIGRLISFFSLVGCAAVVALSVRLRMQSSSRFEKALIPRLFAALTFFCFRFDLMLASLLRFGPHTLYYFFALLSLYLLDRWQVFARVDSRLVYTSALCAVLAVYTKQQGIFAFAVGMLVLISTRSSWRDLIRYGATFAVTAGIFCLYLEIQNNWNFVDNVFFNINRTFPRDMGLSKQVTLEFALGNWIPISLMVVASLITLRHRFWSVWHSAFPVVGALTIMTNGNFGGTANYSFGLWCVIIIVLGQSFAQLFERSTFPLKPFVGACAVVIALLVNTLQCWAEAGPRFVHLSSGVAEARELMRDYYEFVAEVLAHEKNKKVFVARSVGAYVLAGADVNYEFCTVSSFAWKPEQSPFDKNRFLRRLQRQKFSYVVSGVQSFPEEITKVLETRYEPFQEKRVHVLDGTVVQVTLWRPRRIKVRV